MKIFPTKIKGMIYAFFRIIVAFYILTTCAAFLFQTKLIFHPETLASNYKYSFKQPFEERWIESDQTRLNSLLFKNTNSKGLILFFHGNAGSLIDWGYVAAELSEKSNWDVWIIDYPGYGKSEGAISTESQLHSMAEHLWVAAQSEYKEKKIVIFGRSIGTGIAAKLAFAHQSSGLILESPYLSMSSLTHDKFPWLPTSLLLKFTFRSDEWIPEIKSPILMLHGKADPLIPFSQGQALASLRSGVEFVQIENGQHNDLSAFPEYWENLLGWLNKLEIRTNDKSLPKDVAEIIERKSCCGHWSGESPFNSERKREIEVNLEECKCSTFTRDREKIEKKYDKDKKIIQAIQDASDDGE